MALDRFLSSMQDKSGVKLDASTFDSRLRIQKLVYVLGAIGHPDAVPYLQSFNLYMNGPYSPALAKAYYAIKDGTYSTRGEAPRAKAPIPPARPDAESIGLELLAGSAAFMEATATLLKVHRQNHGATREQVKEVVRAMKPHMEEAALEEGLTFLEKHRILPAST